MEILHPGCWVHKARGQHKGNLGIQKYHSVVAVHLVICAIAIQARPPVSQEGSAGEHKVQERIWWLGCNLRALYCCEAGDLGGGFCEHWRRDGGGGVGGATRSPGTPRFNSGRLQNQSRRVENCRNQTADEASSLQMPSGSFFFAQFGCE